MEEINLVGEAFKFMILGMGIVFLFLTIMVFALKLQAKLINKFFKEEEKPEKTKQWQPTTNTSDDSKIAAAITAAIIYHNNKGK